MCCCWATLCAVAILLVAPSSTLQQKLGNLTLLAADNHICSSSTCEGRTNVALCKCDQLCNFFGDCCIDAPEATFTRQGTALKLDSNFLCISTEVHKNSSASEGRAKHYWMIGQCPNTIKSLAEGKIEERLLKGNAMLCESDQFSSPPVTDSDTGLVYRNRYCASCHGIPEARWSPWSSVWECLRSFQEVIDELDEDMIDIETVLHSCDPTVFDEFLRTEDEDRKFPLRQCEPLVHSCPEQRPSDLSDLDYQKIAINCINEPVSATTSVISGRVYKNIYCALCNEPNTVLNGHLQCWPSQVQFSVPSILRTSLTGSFTLLLDIEETGRQVVRDEDIIVTSVKSGSCKEGQVYDFYSNICRTTLCLPGYISDGARCQVITIGNASEDIQPSNCSLITLSRTEYHNVSNGTIYWIEADINIAVVGYDSAGAPIICTNFTANYTITVNETIAASTFQYPEAFTLLTYVGLSVDVLASILFLFTYCVFKELRTFYGKLLMNFVLAILLGDVIFLAGTASYSYYQVEALCQTLGILVHYVFLARFVWMVLLSLKLTVTFYKASKFIPKNEDYKHLPNYRHLCAYMAVGWLTPLIVVGVTIAFNFTLPGTVDYGRNGLCWITQSAATIVSFVAPLGFCLVLNGSAFVYITAVLLKIGCKAVGKHQRGRQIIRNFRVILATFVITGLTWGFGFIAVLDPSLWWAWYPYLALNTMQAVFVALAYLCSVKIFQLYRGACIKCSCLSCNSPGEGRKSQKQRRQVAPHPISTASSPEMDCQEDSLVQIINESKFYVALSDDIV